MMAKRKTVAKAAVRMRRFFFMGLLRSTPSFQRSPGSFLP
jgi:hypothetical protein